MELHVTETEGVPEGCVLSVRAGATRRQAPITADRPFRFPTLPEEATPFKVDVLEPIATARLILRPGEEQRTDCQYTIPLERVGAPHDEVADGSQNVTIAVRPSEPEKEKENEPVETLPKRSTTGSSASSRHGQANAAREYLDQHNLVEFTQLLVQSVIKEQPDRPYAFMAKQFYFPDPQPRPKTCPVDASAGAQADAVFASPSGEAKAAANAAAAVAKVAPVASPGAALPTPPATAGLNATCASTGLGATAPFISTMATAGLGDFNATGATAVTKTDPRVPDVQRQISTMATAGFGDFNATGATAVTKTVPSQDAPQVPAQSAGAFDEEFLVTDTPAKASALYPTSAPGDGVPVVAALDATCATAGFGATAPFIETVATADLGANEDPRTTPQREEQKNVSLTAPSSQDVPQVPMTSAGAFDEEFLVTDTPATASALYPAPAPGDGVPIAAAF